MSNTAKFWIGALLTLPAVALVALATGGASAVVRELTGSYDAASLVSFLVGMVLLAGYVAALVWEKTRWFALGMLAGLAVLLILAAGACVVLIVALTNSYG